ncbi:MAG TPA: DJ-1/PfpI family protein, partial [Pengzhenrongella sp.]
MSTGSPLRVGIFVFDDAEELDVVGPYEVLAAWAALSDLRPEVLTFSTDGSGVRLAKGLRIVPDRSADDVLPLHVLIYPGGKGTRAAARDSAHLDWVRSLRAEVPLMV